MRTEKITPPLGKEYFCPKNAEKRILSQKKEYSLQKKEYSEKLENAQIKERREIVDYFYFFIKI